MEVPCVWNPEDAVTSYSPRTPITPTVTLVTDGPEKLAREAWRLIVVGGHTRSIGKTQLVCDIIAAFPDAIWIAGKITQYGHGVCAQNGHDCDCAPDEHVCAISWEERADTGTDSSRFLAAGAERAFWMRTKQGFLAEGLPILRDALHEAGDEASLCAAPTKVATPRPKALIIESNSLLQFVKPSLYIAVLDPAKEDFKDSARVALDRADALVIRGGGIDAGGAPQWLKLPAKLLREKPSVEQRDGDPLPKPLEVLVRRILEAPPSVVV
jgi:hypothetical protein